MPKVNTSLYGALAIVPQVAEIPIVETLEWLTNSIESQNGIEQQIQLRNKPRQSFVYSVPLQPKLHADAWNTVYGGIRQKWAVPVWAEAQYVGNVANAATFILCNTTDYDLRDSSLAMLFDGCGGWQVLEISTKAADRINLSVTPSRAFRGAMLIPVRVGHAKSDITKPTTGYKGKVSFSFQVDDNLEVSPSAPEQYLGQDIYYDPPLNADEYAPAFTNRQDVIDYEVGGIEYRAPWLNTKIVKQYRRYFGSPSERTAFRNFIHRRAGKTNNFWMPTFEHNLRITNTGTITTILQFPKDGYLDYATQRTHIAIEDLNGVWYPRVMSAPVSTGADTMQATLSSALNIQASTVKRVCYLGLNRLNSDAVEFNYNQPMQSECTVGIIEVTP